MPIDTSTNKSLPSTKKVKKTASVSQKDNSKLIEILKRGHIAKLRGDNKEASKYYLEAWKLEPKNLTAIKHLLEFLYEIGERNKAAKLIGLALEQNPKDLHVISMLGALAKDMEMWGVCKKIQQVYINLCPSNHEGYIRLGFAMHGLEEYDDTISMLQNVIPMFPESAELWNILAMCLSSKGDFEKASYFFKESLKLDPTNAAVLQNLGKTLVDEGKINESIDYLEKAIKLDSTGHSANARLSLSHAYLHKGRLKEGWEQYEFRIHKQDSNKINWCHGLPRWKNENLEEHSLLVCAEQGLGDEILAAASYPQIFTKCRHLHVGCDNRLVSLYKRSFPNAKSIGPYIDRMSNGFRYRDFPLINVLKERIPEAPDLYIEAMTAFARYAETEEQLEHITGGYLIPDEKESALWATRLEAISDRPKVGICWRSQKISSERSRHYVKLEEFLSVLKTPGCDFINLQYGECREELQKMQDQHGITIHNWDDINLKNELDRAAALTKACDLVISVASTPGMISFGVGTPTFWISPLPTWWCFGKQPRIPIFKNARFISAGKLNAWDVVAQKTQAWLQKFIDAPKPLSADFWSAPDE